MDQDEFDYEICIEYEDYPTVKVEPPDDSITDCAPCVSVKIEPCDSDFCNAQQVDNSCVSTADTLCSISNENQQSSYLDVCANQQEDITCVSTIVKENQQTINNNSITDEDIKIIWALPQLMVKKQQNSNNLNSLPLLSEDFIKLEPPEYNEDDESNNHKEPQTVDKSSLMDEQSTNCIIEEIIPSFVSVQDTAPESSLAESNSELDNSQTNKEFVTTTLQLDKQPVENRSRIQNIRSSTVDGEFDLDEENFAKLDQPYNDVNVTLDPYNADLNIKIDADTRLVGESLSHEGFVFMLAGVRATHGFNSGKVGFEVKMLEIIDVSNSKPEEIYAYEMRAGWSTGDSSYRLGETANSFAYCNNGKKANLNMFAKIGPSYDVGDIVGCLFDFDSMQINFTLNGRNVNQDGYVFKLPDNMTTQNNEFSPFFPHICVKNVKFEVNFGRLEKAWCGLPDGYTFVDHVRSEQRFPGPLPPLTKQECTVMCMIGLPGSGKTTWVRQYLQNHPNESWMLLSTNAVLDQMKVQGEPRKKKHQGRWDLMMGVVVKCLNKLILLACRMRKNYILDTTNVYPLPRRKKMTPFKDFTKKAVVLVPTVEDYANRCFQQMRHEGKQMPSDAMLEMKACFTLPKEDEDVFDRIEFVELQREDAQKVVDYFNEEGKSFKPREKKRRGDWQQEELPPKQSKISLPFPTSSSVVSKNQPLNSVSRPTSAFPYGIPSSLRTYTPSPSPAFTRQWSTTTNSGTTVNQNSNNLSNAWSQLRGNTNGYTPRAGWPANWPQASWNQPSTPANIQITPSSANSNSQFVFPSPSMSSSS